MQSRHQQLTHVYENAFKGERGTQYQNYEIRNHNVRIFQGDLNFRLSDKVSSKEAQKLIAEKKYG